LLDLECALFFHRSLMKFLIGLERYKNTRYSELIINAIMAHLLL